MHLWDGLFRARQHSPGRSPETPELFGANSNSLRHAASRTPGNSSTTSSGTPATQQQQQALRWHSAGLTSSNSSRQYQPQFSRSSPDLVQASAADGVSSSSGSQPVQIPESKVLPYSRLRAHSAGSRSSSPSRGILASNGSPAAAEPVLGAPAAAAAAAGSSHQRGVNGSSSSGGTSVPQQQHNLILRAHTRSKRPPPCPSPPNRSQLLSNASSGGNAPPSPRCSPAAAAASGSLTGYPYPSSVPQIVPPRVSASPAAAGGSAGSYPDAGVLQGGLSEVLRSSSSNARTQQQQYDVSHNASPNAGLSPLQCTSSLSPAASDSILAQSLQMSPATAAAAAAVGEAVAAVAGNPLHPHHEQTMQLLLQHQQLQFQQLQQQQQQQGYVTNQGSDRWMSNPGDYYGGLAAQQSPQSPRVLESRSNSYNRLNELGTSPGLIEASFMGLAARPKPQLNHSSSFTAGSSSSRWTTLQRMQQAEYSTMRQQQQQQQQQGFGSTRSSPAVSPRVSRIDSGSWFADHDVNNMKSNVSNNQQLTPPTAAAAAAGRGPAASVGFSWDGSSSSSAVANAPPGAAAAAAAGSSRNDLRSVPPGQRSGIRALPGQTAIHWISRADEEAPLARGLLGLPAPGALAPTYSGSSSKQQQQQQGLGICGSLPSKLSGSLGEIEASDHDVTYRSQSQTMRDLQYDQQQQQRWQQQQQGDFSGFDESQICKSASFESLVATPAKIGEGSSAAAAAGSSSGQVAAAAWFADNSISSSNGSALLATTARSGSFQKVAAALAAAPAISPTSAAAAAAGSSLSRHGSSALLAADSYSTSTPRAAAAAVLDTFGSGMSVKASPRTSPRAAAAAGSSPYRTRSLNRYGSGGLGSRSGSTLGFPTCLICLDQLTPEDFENGEAMQLDCKCKGEVALRHRQCAEKWSRIKGSTICDVCKAPILNLPDVPPLPTPPGQGLGNPVGGLFGPGDQNPWAIDEPPAVADHIFDCIRVTWVVLIVCILLLELSVTRSFVTGALIGTAYVAVTASWSAAARRRQRHRLAAAAADWVQGRQTDGSGLDDQRLPLLRGQVGGIEGLPV